MILEEARGIRAALTMFAFLASTGFNAYVFFIMNFWFRTPLGSATALTWEGKALIAVLISTWFALAYATFRALKHRRGC